MKPGGAFNLADIHLFRKLTPQELGELWDLGEVLHVRPHAHIVIEGEPTHSLYILMQGRVSVYRNDPEATAMSRLAMLEEGAHFGELSLIDQAPRSATVVAETTCQLYQLTAERFHTWLRQAPMDTVLSFYRNCAEELAIRMRHLNNDYITAQRQLWKYALRKANS